MGAGNDMFLINRHKRFKFTERHHSTKGILVSLVSSAILVGYGVVLAQAYGTDGTLSMYYGSVGLALLALAVIMLILAIQSLMEEDSYPLFPRLALVSSILAIACWAGTYALGLGLFG
jgi:hypothetical protein